MVSTRFNDLPSIQALKYTLSLTSRRASSSLTVGVVGNLKTKASFLTKTTIPFSFIFSIVLVDSIAQRRHGKVEFVGFQD